MTRLRGTTSPWRVSCYVSWPISWSSSLPGMEYPLVSASAGMSLFMASLGYHYCRFRRRRKYHPCRPVYDTSEPFGDKFVPPSFATALNPRSRLTAEELQPFLITWPRRFSCPLRTFPFRWNLPNQLQILLDFFKWTRTWTPLIVKTWSYHLPSRSI